MKESKLLERNEIDVKDTWRLEDMFESDEAWENEYETTKNALKQVVDYAEKISQSPDNLLSCLKLVDKVGNSVERLYVYSNQRYHQDMSVSKYQEYAGKAETLFMEFGSNTSFIEPEILEMDDAVINEWLEMVSLSNYKRFLSEILRKKEHTLDKKTEEILAKSRRIAQAADNIYTMFNGADIDFPVVTDNEGKEIKLTHGNFVPIQTGTDRVLRERAFKAFYGTYDKMKNTLAATFNANVSQAVFYADVRHYNSTREMYLNGSNIPEEVYDNLIDTVHRNMDLMYRYVALRKKMLGVDELHMYDVYVPIVDVPDRYIPFEEAKEIVAEGLSVMGEDYIRTLREGFDNRWIDVYENKGKKSGAYSWGAYGTHPYVLLNYQGNLDHVFTLAHEMGHALHSYYSNKNQKYINADYRIFVAEVASICNEALLIRHMINKTEDKKEKAYLINHFLEQFKGTLYRQTMFAEFEKITHRKVEEGETLTSESLSNIYYELNKLYFGEEMISDEEIALEWARIPHFYSPFYVYQYATGLSAAIALSAKILREGESGVNDYMKFLTGGCTKDPIDLLKMAGVDMTTPKPVEDALQLFKELLDEMEQLTLS